MLRTSARALARSARRSGFTQECTTCTRCFRAVTEPAVLATAPGSNAASALAGGQLLGGSLHRPHHASLAGPAAFAAMQQQQRRGMFIQTQATPNPASLMFMPGQQVMQSGSVEFKSAREGMTSPLAKRLFGIDGVDSIFFGGDFVTVTKSEEYPWSVLKPDIFAAIMDHFTSGEPIFTDATSAASDTMISDDDSEIVAMIKELLETRIRPAVQEDGGDIVYQGFEEDTGRVLLQMRGACSGCPSSAVTLKNGIQGMLQHYIPEVKEVIEIEDEGQKVGAAEFSKLEAQLSA